MAAHSGGDEPVDEHPNATAFRRVLDAMDSGDMQSAMEALADDVEWHEIGRAEPIRGKATMMERFTSGEGAGWDITGETHDVLANDEHAIALVNATARKDGQEFHYRTAEIVHMRDGKITARWAFSDDTDAINRFFGS
jgi:ketosteroid isomerase-like protein